MVYFIMRKYIILTPGWKGTLMSDIDTQILLLFHQLNAEQKQEFICLAQSMLTVAQEEMPSDPQTASS